MKNKIIQLRVSEEEMKLIELMAEIMKTNKSSAIISASKSFIRDLKENGLLTKNEENYINDERLLL